MLVCGIQARIRLSEVFSVKGFQAGSGKCSDCCIVMADSLETKHYQALFFYLCELVESILIQLFLKT